MDIGVIQEAASAVRFRVSDHADEEMAADGPTLDDVLESVAVGEVVEEYPSDHPLPSCLIYGVSASGSHIHSVWAYNGETGRAVLVTVYRPDPNRWENGRRRKPQP